jgi:hypothetical protein
MNMKKLLEAMTKFAGEPEQKPGDQVKATDVAKASKGSKHPFLNQLVGDSKEIEKKRADNALEESLAEQWANFDEAGIPSTSIKDMRNGKKQLQANATFDDGTHLTDLFIIDKDVEANEYAQLQQFVKQRARELGKTGKILKIQYKPWPAMSTGTYSGKADVGRLAEAADSESLNIGDDVIITGAVTEKGKTGVVTDLGRNGRFVVVNLYNGGQHSFHSSDVSFNEYANSDAEEAEMYDKEGDDWYDDLEEARGRNPDDEYDERRQGKLDDATEREQAKRPQTKVYTLTGRGPNMEPNYRFPGEYTSQADAVAARKKLMANPKTPNPTMIGIDQRTRYLDIKESIESTDPLESALLSAIQELISQGHVDVDPTVLTNMVVAATSQPFLLKDLVDANNNSQAVQHYIDSISPSKVKFSSDMLTVKNEDPAKDKAKSQAGVSSMASRAAGRNRLGEGALNEDAELSKQGFPSEFIKIIYSDAAISHDTQPVAMTKKPTIKELNRNVIVSKGKDGNFYGARASDSGYALYRLVAGSQAERKYADSAKEVAAWMKPGQYFAIPFNVTGYYTSRSKNRADTNRTNSDIEQRQILKQMNAIFTPAIKQKIEVYIEHIYANLRKLSNAPNSANYMFKPESAQQAVISIANALEELIKKGFSQATIESYLESINKRTIGWGSGYENTDAFVNAMKEPLAKAKFAQTLLSQANRLHLAVNDMLYKPTMDALTSEDTLSESFGNLVEEGWCVVQDGVMVDGPFDSKREAEDSAMREINSKGPQADILVKFGKSTSKGYYIQTKAVNPVNEEKTVAESSDISGLMAASHLNKQFRIKTDTKTYKVKAQSANVAKEILTKKFPDCKILSVTDITDLDEMTLAGYANSVKFAKGDRVSHGALGNGTVTKQENDNVYMIADSDRRLYRLTPESVKSLGKSESRLFALKERYTEISTKLREFKESKGQAAIASKLDNMDNMRNVQVPTPEERREQIRIRKAKEAGKKQVKEFAAPGIAGPAANGAGATVTTTPQPAAVKPGADTNALADTVINAAATDPKLAAKLKTVTTPMK